MMTIYRFLFGSTGAPQAGVPHEWVLEMDEVCGSWRSEAPVENASWNGGVGFHIHPQYDIRYDIRYDMWYDICYMIYDIYDIWYMIYMIYMIWYDMIW